MMDPHSGRFVRYRERGDLEALAEVFDATAPRLLRLAMHLCSDPADAEDVLQQTFVVAMQKAGSFASDQRLEPWLAGILAGEARNRVRSRRRRAHAELPDQELRDRGEGPAAAAERQELVATLRANIGELPAEQRQALLLQLQHGLAPVEIAEVLDLPPGTVRMRIHRGLAALRRLLPTGLALWLFGAFATRGLANVRQAVLAAGRRRTGATIAFGGFTAAKWLAGAAVALLAACAWLWWPSPPPAAPTTAAHSVVTPPAAASDGAAGEAAAMARSAVDAPQPAGIVATGALRVTVHARTTTPSTTAAEAVAHTAAGPSPIAGLTLRAWPGGSALPPFDGSDRIVQTDAAGEARFDALRPGPWHVQTTGGFPAETSAAEVVADRETGLDVTLAGESWVCGRVVDAAGAPVADAEVVLSSLPGLAFAPNGEEAREDPDEYLRVAARSAADGSFRCVRGPKEHYVAARHPEHAPSYTQLALARDMREFTLELGAESGALSGVVVDADGQPVPAASVAAHPNGAWVHRRTDGTWLEAPLATCTRTDANGRFRFARLRPGSVAVWARSTQSLPAAAYGVVIAPGRETEVELRIVLDVLVLGTVSRADGSAADALDVALKRDPDENGVFDRARTRADGSFAIGAPRQPFWLVVQGQSPLLQHRCEPTGPGELRVALTLPDRPALAGRVVDADGHGLADWYVGVDDDAAHGPPMVGTTDADGAFVVRDLPADVVRMRAMCQWGDFEQAPCVRDHVSTRAGELLLRVPPDAMPHGVVRGRLVDTSGAPLAGVDLQLARDGRSARSRATTDGVGAFRIDGIAPGDWHLTASAPEQRARRLRPLQVAADSDLDLGAVVLAPQATLRIAFVTTAGAPWSGMLPEVFLRDAAQQYVQCAARVDEHAATVIDLEPGAYHATLEEGDLIATDLTFELAPGERRDVRWQLAVGRGRTLVFAGDRTPPIDSKDVLHAQVVDARGRVAHEAALRRSPHGDGNWTLSHTFEFGDYTVTGVTDSGRRYRGAFTVDEALDAASQVDVPLVR